MIDPVDPELLSAGPATRAVRALLRLAIRTRWFEPAPADKPTFFAHHLALVRRHVPTAFAADVEITEQVGGFSALERLAARVRDPASRYDWKFDVLKKMVRAHSEARGWSALAHARAFQGPEPSPGDLFVLLHEHAYWRVPVAKLELARAGSAPEAAEWYAGFGQNDLVEAIEWQLAEGTNDLETNPFVPLLRGYAMGQCPFVIDGEHVVVLRFGAPPS